MSYRGAKGALTRIVTLYLNFRYPPDYPDVLPEMSFESIDEESGELREGEEDVLLEELRKAVRPLGLVTRNIGADDCAGRGVTGDGHDIHARFARA